MANSKTENYHESAIPTGEGGNPLRQLVAFVKLYARFVRYVFPYWDKIVLLVLLAQSIGLMWVLSALSGARAVDEGLRAGDAEAFFMWTGIWFAVQGTLYLVYNFQTIMTTYLRTRVELALKLRIFDRFQEQSLRFHQSRPIGENMFRINNDSMHSANVTAAALPDILSRLITIATTGTLLIQLSPQIAVGVVLYVVIYYTYSHLLTNFSKRFQEKVRANGQAVLAMLQENLSAYTISKAMSREKHESRRYFNRVSELARQTMRYGVSYGLTMEGLRWLWHLFIHLMQWGLVGVLVIKGTMTIGEFYAVGQILFYVIGPMQVLVATIIWFRVAAVTLRRMLQTIDAHEEIPEDPNAEELTDPRGEIEFRDVWFRYTPTAEDAIKGLSFKVPAGKKVAIVGSSGAGKTSIFNLIMRYYEPTAGQVLIDGKDLAKLNLRSYHDHVSIVLQDNFMYSASIRDNILFGKPDATDAELQRAIGLAGLEKFLAELPGGLDRVLKEGGDLSAGQLQRIGIARAVLRDPRFLYLDEATSSLDPVTEAEILRQMKKVEAGRTRLVIAHNIVSVRDSDEIIVMQRGEIVQRGRHEELVAQDGIYQEMWQAELEKMAHGEDGA